MPRQAQPPTPPPSAELARADAVRGIRAVSTAPPGAHADRRRMRTRRAHARIGCASPPSEPPLAPTLCLYTLPPPSVCARHVPTRVARQVRRESTDVESLFIGHINGMDTMARGLRSAVKMMSDGTFDAMLHERCDLAPRSRSPAPAPHCPSGRARVHRVDAPVAHEACMAAGGRALSCASAWRAVSVSVSVCHGACKLAGTRASPPASARSLPTARPRSRTWRRWRRRRSPRSRRPPDARCVRPAPFAPRASALPRLSVVVAAGGVSLTESAPVPLGGAAGAFRVDLQRVRVQVKVAHVRVVPRARCGGAPVAVGEVARSREGGHRDSRR